MAWHGLLKAEFRGAKHWVLTESLTYELEKNRSLEMDRWISSWANLNVTGTIALRDSLNVASITDDGTGDYDFTYTTAFGNVNYSVSGNHAEDNGLYSNYGAGSMVSWFNSSRTTSECHVSCTVDEDTFRDMRTVDGQFIGDLA